MSVLDNVLIALRRGRLGNPLRHRSRNRGRRRAEGLAGVCRLSRAARQRWPAICRMSIGAWSRSPARWRRVRGCCCSTSPPPGLMRADKVALGKLMRRIADLGIAVILVEHDMALVMGISDHIVVLDAGAVIAAGDARRQCAAIRAVLKAYLGDGEMRARPRAGRWRRLARCHPVLPQADRRLWCGAGARGRVACRCGRARWSRCSAPTAPANRRRCAP